MQEIEFPISQIDPRDETEKCRNMRRGWGKGKNNQLRKLGKFLFLKKGGTICVNRILEEG